MELVDSQALTLDRAALAETLGEVPVPDEARLAALAALAESFVHAPSVTILPEPRPASKRPPRPPSPSATGLELGETLGQGGMGVVRRAVQRSLGREVAAKTVRDDRRTEAAKAQLAREAWVTGMLEHPNVVPVHDLRVDEDGTPVVVLKRIEGDGWHELLAEPDRVDDRFFARDPLAWHLGVLLSVCKAVELAHSRGVLHRDLKPENVMVGRFGEVIVVDWGVAATIDPDADPRLPRVDDRVVGTPAYMAPEMARGDVARVGPRTDVYLLGAVLFELLAGHPPHRGETVIQVLGSVLLSDPQLPDDTPEELRTVCERALSRDPANRYGSVAELRRALEDHLEHRASIHTCARAEDDLAELEQLLAAPADEVDREKAHRQLGQCRFGFEHALSTWPDNLRARAGRDRALCAVARFELAGGRATAAADLLSPVDVVPDDLVRDLEDALSRERHRRTLMAEGERQRREMDPNVFRRQRVIFGMLIGTVWVTGPIIALVRSRFFGQEQALHELAVWPFVIAAVFVSLTWLYRAALLGTEINRRVIGTFLGAMLMMGLFHWAGILAGLTAAQIQSLDFVLFSAVGVYLTFQVDRRFGIPTAVFFGSLFTAVLWPGQRYWLQLLSGVTAVWTMAWIWKPWRRDAP